MDLPKHLNFDNGNIKDKAYKQIILIGGLGFALGAVHSEGLGVLLASSFALLGIIRGCCFPQERLIEKYKDHEIISSKDLKPLITTISKSSLNNKSTYIQKLRLSLQTPESTLLNIRARETEFFNSFGQIINSI